jgi:hypothetical protein
MTSLRAFGHTICGYNIRGNRYITPLRITSTSGLAGSHVSTSIRALTLLFQLFPSTQEALP